MEHLDAKEKKRSVAAILIAILITISGIVFTYIEFTEHDDSSKDGLDNELVKPFEPSFPKFNRAPVLYVVNVTNLTYDEILILDSIQGLVNRDSAALYLEHGNPKWLIFLNETYDQPYEYISFDDALIKFKTKASGLVVYNPEATATVNVATTLAGYDDLIMVPPKLISKISGLTGLNVSVDLREGSWATFGNSSTIYIEVLEKIYPELNQNIFGMLRPAKIALRDYLIAIQAMCVDINPGPMITPEEDEVVSTILETTPTQNLVLGWFKFPTGLEENVGTQRLSQTGKVLVPADQIPNLSVFAAYDFKEPPAESNAKPVEIPKLEDNIYITFAMSDGDNLGFMHNKYADIWDATNRGDFPLGWSVSPLAAEIAPPVYEYYFASATENDTLVCGASGAGLFYPDFYPQAELGPLLDKTDELMTLSGLETIWLLNSYAPYEVRYSDRVIEAYIDHLKPTGIFLDYGDVPLTKQYWIGKGNNHSGTPIIRATHMWEDIENFIAKVEVAKDSVKDGPFFIFAPVHVWTLGPEDVKEVIDRLNINDPASVYKMVSPNEFCRLIQIAEVEKAKENIKSLDEWPYNLGQADKASIRSHVDEAEDDLENEDYDSAAYHASEANNMINRIKVDLLTSVIIIILTILIILANLVFYLTRRRYSKKELRKKGIGPDVILDFRENIAKGNFILNLEIIMLFFVSATAFILVYRVLYSNFWDLPAIFISICVAIGFVPITNRKFYYRQELSKRIIFGLSILFIFGLCTLISSYFLPIVILGFMVVIESAPATRKYGIVVLLSPMIFGMIFAGAFWSIPITILIFASWAICIGSLLVSFKTFQHGVEKTQASIAQDITQIRKDLLSRKIEIDVPSPPILFLVISLLIIYIPYSRYLSIKLDDLPGLLTNISYIIPVASVFIAFPIAYHLRVRLLQKRASKYAPGIIERAVVMAITTFAFGAIFFTWEPLLITFLILIGEVCFIILVFITMPTKWLVTYSPYLSRDLVNLFLIMNLVFIIPVITYTLYVTRLGGALNYILYAFPLSFAIGLIIMILPVAFYWRKENND